MFPVFTNSTPRRNWTVQFNLSVDFAVWTLEQDGLHIPPFTTHPALLGNQILTDAGLTPAGWQHWFDTLLSCIHDRPESAPWQLYEADSAVRDMLQRLWGLYLPMSNARKGAVSSFNNELLSQRNLQTLLQIDNDISADIPLRIFLTGYPFGLAHIQSPGLIILAPAGGHITEGHLKTILCDSLSA